MAMLLPLLVLLFAPATVPASAELRPAAEVPLAVEVFEAHGGDAWPGGVAEVRFTFRVADGGGEKLAAQHVWDVAAMTDTVTWNGRTVTVDLNDPQDKEAFARWTNDSYWLVAPLKLMDEGVVAAELPEADGARRLLVGFRQVGLTPGDRYLYEIDPATKQVLAWTFMPNETVRRRFEWSGYDTFGPLTLSTDHATAEGFRVYFTGVSVERR